MAVNEENDDLVYEIDEKGNRVLVRSINSDHSVYIRFINGLISRPLDVWWRDFQGKRRFYVRMQPRTYFDVDTFVTHPWEFTDPGTDENYVIQNKRFFRAPLSLADMKHRTKWIITVKVRTLRNTALLALAERLDENMVPELGLPHELSNDLASLIYSLRHMRQPPNRT